MSRKPIAEQSKKRREARKLFWWGWLTEVLPLRHRNFRPLMMRINQKRKDNRICLILQTNSTMLQIQTRSSTPRLVQSSLPYTNLVSSLDLVISNAGGLERLIRMWNNGDVQLSPRERGVLRGLGGMIGLRIAHMIFNPTGRRREPTASDTKAQTSVYAMLDREFSVRRILLSKVKMRMWEVVDAVLLVAEVEVRRRGFRDIENDIICPGEVDESTSHRSVLDSRLQRICSKSASD